MMYLVFLLFLIMLFFIFSNINLWGLIIIIIFILNYSIILFFSTKSVISFISFLTYISAILILMTYMVVISSSTMDSHKFWIFYPILFLSSIFFMDVLETSAQINYNFDLLSVDLFQFYFSIGGIFLIQCFLYLVTLDIKSLRFIL